MSQTQRKLETDSESKTERFKDFVTKWHSGMETTEWEKLNQRYLTLPKYQQNALDVVTIQVVKLSLAVRIENAFI